MEQRTRPDNRTRRRRFNFGRLLFPLVFAVILLSVLSDRIPALREARERLLSPETHRARAACHEAALAAADDPQFARIVARGAVYPTQGAQYVQGVRVGEMGPDGAEVTFDFSCYVDPDGNLVKTHKEAPPPPRAR